MVTPNLGSDYPRSRFNLKGSKPLPSKAESHARGSGLKKVRFPKTRLWVRILFSNPKEEKNKLRYKFWSLSK